MLYPLGIPCHSDCWRGIHLTLSCLALTALKVTFMGGCLGGAWMVWNRCVGSEGLEGPTTLWATSLSSYSM